MVEQSLIKETEQKMTDLFMRKFDTDMVDLALQNTHLPSFVMVTIPLSRDYDVNSSFKNIVLKAIQSGSYEEDDILELMIQEEYDVCNNPLSNYVSESDIIRELEGVIEDYVAEHLAHELAEKTTISYDLKEAVKNCLVQLDDHLVDEYGLSLSIVNSKPQIAQMLKEALGGRDLGVASGDNLPSVLMSVSRYVIGNTLQNDPKSLEFCATAFNMPEILDENLSAEEVGEKVKVDLLMDSKALSMPDLSEFLVKCLTSEGLDFEEVGEKIIFFRD